MAETHEAVKATEHGSEVWHPDCLQQGCIRQLHGGEHCGKGCCSVLHTRRRASVPGSEGE